MRGKEHYPPKCVVRQPFSLFTCLAITQQATEPSPRDPRVVSLPVNAGYFSTKVMRATPPTWGLSPLRKQTLNSKCRLSKREVSRS